MVLLCGIPTESPLLLVRDRLDDMRMPFLVLSQRRFAEIPFRFRISEGCVTGEVVIDRRAYPLEDIFGVYTRLMDYRSLPEVSGEPAGSALRALAHDWHDAVSRWLLAETTPLSLPDARWDRLIYPVLDCESFLRARAPRL